MQNAHCTKSGPGRRHDAREIRIRKNGRIDIPAIRGDKIDQPRSFPGSKMRRAAEAKTLTLRE